jgi:hypothetical protein
MSFGDPATAPSDQTFLPDGSAEKEKKNVTQYDTDRRERIRSSYYYMGVVENTTE